MLNSNERQARRKIMGLFTSHRRAVLCIIVIVIVATSGVLTYSQRSQDRPQPASDLQAWSDLQQGILAMHSAMSSAQSTGNEDEDFVQLMLPHHQAALDMARVELTHGRDPQMRRLAQEIIADQESEIELMKLWLEQNDRGKPQPSTSAAKER